MKELIRSFSWFLYGGVSCYCMQRFFVDFIPVKNDASQLFQTGDIVVLDVWNRLKLNRKNLICAKSPDNHHQIIFGRVVAFPNESVNVQSVNRRIKLVQVPKGSIAVQLFTDEIKIIPMGLIEGRTLARIWPFKRYTSRLLNMPSTSDS